MENHRDQVCMEIPKLVLSTTVTVFVLGQGSFMWVFFFSGVLQDLLKTRISESCVIFCGLGYIWLDMENLSYILRTAEWLAPTTLHSFLKVLKSINFLENMQSGKVEFWQDMPF